VSSAAPYPTVPVDAPVTIVVEVVTGRIRWELGYTLAGLLRERAGERVQLPLVGPPSPRWEPEPLRWLTVTRVQRLGDSLDEAELAGRPSARLHRALFKSQVRRSARQPGGRQRTLR
jgi:hypothetical protein